MSDSAADAANEKDVVNTNNPFLQQDGLPKFASLDAATQLTPAVDLLLDNLERDFRTLEETCQNNDNNINATLLEDLEKLQFPIEYAWGVAGHLNGVMNTDALRKAYEANQPKIVKATTAISQSKPIYQALLKLQASLPEKKKSNENFESSQKRRAVELALRSMKLGGVGLEGEEKERCKEIKQRLATLKTDFVNHVLDATKQFSLTITDSKQIENVPASAKALWASAHAKAEEGKDEVDSQQGPWRLTLDMPSYMAIMNHVPDRDVREKVYRAYITRASTEELDNVPLIYEILQLKHEMANLLGFDNYAQQSLDSKMAPSIESIRELSDLIRDKALPAALLDLDQMTQLAHQQSQDNSMTKLEPWDLRFWTERWKESKFDLTEEETRPYFALPAVLNGMFRLVQRLFEIDVIKADGQAEIWHDDVRFFKIFSDNRHIASFYLDPYSRPETKRGGAWMGTCLGKSAACNIDVPVAYLTCNGSPPVGNKPSLMTFREVETLFHEFGHGLQHMLTKVKLGDVAGINGIEWDAVELPSQFMENWCYDRPTVYAFAKHWETKEPMPDDMFEKLKEQKTFNAGMMACRQLLFGQLDMELHSNFDASQGPDSVDAETIFDIQQRVAKKYTPYSMPIPEDRFLCSFSHIFAGGYAAGYYSYKWAEVMSADAFSAFEDAGLDEEEKVKKVGRRFRDTVLSLGGGVDPNTVFADFRGREPSPEALLRHNGLVAG